ncbi:MAG: DUF4058 family protein [Caldilineaceae bacterium]|nr:DUF4058 family protein [Caldilineaceae bacterium]
MPSPFPGMDPYLENHSIWPDVHSTMIAYIRESLQPRLRPRYVARIGERIELAEMGQAYVPDVLIVQPQHGPVRMGAVAEMVADMVADQPMTIGFLDEERRVPYIEIVHRETGDVITLIEVLSPVNKVGNGRKRYLQKQDDLANSYMNLVEIDLLSFGEPTTLARKADTLEAPEWRYVVSVRRAQRRGQLEVYPFGLMDRLPRCRIPLRPDDPDVVLDLPAVFARCYEVGGYDLMIDYTRPPDVDLSDEEETWVRGLLDALRTPST